MVMKRFINVMLFALATTIATAYAQLDIIHNLRSYDKKGIGVFESPKDEVQKYEGLKLRFGAGFTQ